MIRRPAVILVALCATAPSAFGQAQQEDSSQTFRADPRAPELATSLDDVCAVNPRLGVVWAGRLAEPIVPVAVLARRAAPILWFSPEEPLSAVKDAAESTPPFPSPLPCHYAPYSKGTRVVYYRLQRVIREKGGATNDPILTYQVNAALADQSRSVISSITPRTSAPTATATISKAPSSA